MKNNKNSGFTLVELVVVLVIIAILAGFLVPALTGYIDKANNAQLIEQCRLCVQASQTMLTEEYAAGEKLELDTDKIFALAELDPQKTFLESSEFTPRAQLEHLILRSADKYVVYCSLGGCEDCGISARYEVLKQAPSISYQAKADSAFGSIGSKYLEGYSGRKIDGVNATTPGTGAYEIYNTLNDSQKEFLSNVSWSIVKSTGGWRLYFTTENYGTESAENVKVYKYNMETKKYQYVTDGKVQNGKVLADGHDWRADEEGAEWSDTIN